MKINKIYNKTQYVDLKNLPYPWKFYTTAAAAMLVTFRKTALALHLPKESPPLALFDDIVPLIFKEIFQHLLTQQSEISTRNL